MLPTSSESVPLPISPSEPHITSPSTAPSADPSQKKEATKIAEHINKSIAPSKFVKFKQGAVKIIWVNQIQTSGIHTPKVYLTPQTGLAALLKDREGELQKEIATMYHIDSMLKKEGSTDHLAVKLKEVESQDSIDGQLTLEVSRAEKDFEKWITSDTPTIQERFKLGGHFLKGLENLQKIGFAYGDMKPENALIYRKGDDLLLKIADFGKTVEVGDAEKDYEGNTRFAPPEFRASLKGDIYSSALVVIRDIEEEYLIKDNVNTLKPVTKKRDFDQAAKPSYRGIEKYVVEHKAFLACNAGMSGRSLYRRNKAKTAHQTELEKAESQKAIHSYINALEIRMKKDGRLISSQTEQLCQLFREMTRSEPSERPTAAQCSARYQKIVSRLTTSDT